MKHFTSTLSPLRFVALFSLAFSTFCFTGCKEGYDIFEDIKGNIEDNEDMDDGDEKDMDGDMNGSWLFASTNTGGNFTIFDVNDLNKIRTTTAMTGNMDADGIYYDANKDIVYQLSRTQSQVNAYTDASWTKGGEDVSPAFSSTSDFTNGREITVSGDKLIVAEDVDEMNRLIVYTLGDGTITLDKIYNVHFNLWGIQLVDGTLYAVKDVTNMLAVFEGFLSNPEGDIQPTKSVAIEELVRTHGLNYDASQDIMVMTDIGDAGSDSDGGLYIIPEFSKVLMDTDDEGTISKDEHLHFRGDKTMLGNPVDVAISADKMLYVAERANGGGQILVFNYPNGSEYCNVKPFKTIAYEGASAVYLSEEE